VNKSILCIAAFCALGIASSAVAEEMATPPSSFVTARVPYLAWSGVYFGINGGYAWSNPNVAYVGNDPASRAGLCVSPGSKCIPTADFQRDGALFGGQVGYNWQFNSRWLAGAEADYQWSDLFGTGYSQVKVSGVNGLSTMAAKETVHSFGTFRARLGALPLQSLLVYGTAGLAVGQLRAHERGHVVMPGLMSFESVEEAFYEDERVVARLNGSVQIEQHMRFAEACGKAVFGLRRVDGATRVGDEFAVFVVDGNHHPPAKEPVAIVVANTEMPGRLGA